MNCWEIFQNVTLKAACQRAQFSESWIREWAFITHRGKPSGDSCGWGENPPNHCLPPHACARCRSPGTLHSNAKAYRTTGTGKMAALPLNPCPGSQPQAPPVPAESCPCPAMGENGQEGRGGLLSRTITFPKMESLSPLPKPNSGKKTWVSHETKT